MRLLKKMIYFVVGAYVLLIILAFIFQSKVIFHPVKLPYDYRFLLNSDDREIFLKTDDGETINALFYQGKGTQVVLYFHGNAGALESWQGIAANFLAAGYSVLIIDYRGYGKSTGTISERGFYNDAEAGWLYLTGTLEFLPENIIIYGRSIGTGVAVKLATTHDALGLVLEAPYTSLPRLATEKVSWLFPSLWLRFHFDNLEQIALVKSPVMFIHGDSDTLIPISHSKKLYDAYNGRKVLAIVPQGGHNNLTASDEYVRILTVQMREFFK